LPPLVVGLATPVSNRPLFHNIVHRFITMLMFI